MENWKVPLLFFRDAELLNTVELRFLQDWQIANNTQEIPTAEELAQFNQYRNSAEGNAAFEALRASAPLVNNT